MELSEEVVKYEASLGDAMMKYGMSNESGKMLAKELLAREMQARELLAREMGSQTGSQDRRKKSKSRKSKQQNADSFCGNSVALSTDGSLRSSRSRWEPNDSEQFQHESASLPAEFLYFKFEQMVSRWANMRMSSVMSLERFRPLHVLKNTFKSSHSGPPRTITTIANPANDSAPTPAPAPSPTSRTNDEDAAKSSTPEQDQNLPRFMRSTNTSATRRKSDAPLRGRSNSPQKKTAKTNPRGLTVETGASNKTRPARQASPSPARNQAAAQRPASAKNRSPSPFRNSSPMKMTESQKRKQRMTMKPPTPKFTGGNNNSSSDSAKRSETRGPQNTTERLDAPHYQRRDSAATRKSNLPDPEPYRPDPDGQQRKASPRVRSPSPQPKGRSSTPASARTASNPRTTQRGASPSPQRKKAQTKPQTFPEPPKPTTRKKKSRLPPIPSFRNPSPKPKRKEESSGQTEEEAQQRDPTPQSRSADDAPQRDPTPQRKYSADDEQDAPVPSPKADDHQEIQEDAEEVAEERETSPQTDTQETQEVPQEREISPSKRASEQAPGVSSPQNEAQLPPRSPRKGDEAEQDTYESPIKAKSPLNVSQNQSSIDESSPLTTTPSPRNVAKSPGLPRNAVESPRNNPSPHNSPSYARAPSPARRVQRQQQNRQASPIRSRSPQRNTRNLQDRKPAGSPRQWQKPVANKQQTRQSPVSRRAKSSPTARGSPQPRRYRRMHVFSATVIQSYYRMLPIRRDYLHMRRTIILLQSLFRRQVQVKVYKRLVKGRRLRNFSSTVIQRNYRMAICRTSYHQLKHETIVIQAAVRMFLCRSTYADLINASKKLLGRNLSSPSNTKVGQVTVRGGRLRIYSALLIQSLVRMRWVRAAYLEIVTSAKTIQKWFRNVQKIINKQNHAAKVVQSWVRMASYRECYLDLRANVIIVQAYIRMMSARAKFKKSRLDRSAVRLQALCRKKFCRRAYEQLHAATGVLQVWVRGWTARVDYLKLRSATISLQCQARKHMSTQIVVESRAAVAIQAAFRAFLRTSEFMARRMMICMIQSGVRRFLQRKKYLSLESAIRSLQRVHRGNMSRAYAAARRSVLWVENTKMRRLKHHVPYQNLDVIDADNRIEPQPRYDNALSAALAFVSNPNGPTPRTRSKLDENLSVPSQGSRRTPPITLSPEHHTGRETTGDPWHASVYESKGVWAPPVDPSAFAAGPEQQPLYRPMPGASISDSRTHAMMDQHTEATYLSRSRDTGARVGLVDPRANHNMSHMGYHPSYETSPGAPRTPPQHGFPSSGIAPTGLHVPSLQFPKQYGSPSSPYEINSAYPTHQSSPYAPQARQEYLQSPGRLLPRVQTEGHPSTMPQALPSNLVPAPAELVAKMPNSGQHSVQPLYFISQSPGGSSMGSPQIYAFHQINNHGYAMQQSQPPGTYFPSPPHANYQQEMQTFRENIKDANTGSVQQRSPDPSTNFRSSHQANQNREATLVSAKAAMPLQKQASYASNNSQPQARQQQEIIPFKEEEKEDFQSKQSKTTCEDHLLSPQVSQQQRGTKPYMEDGNGREDMNASSEPTRGVTPKEKPGLKGTILEGLKRGRTQRRTPKVDPNLKAFSHGFRHSSPLQARSAYQRDKGTLGRTGHGQSHTEEAERIAKENEPAKKGQDMQDKEAGFSPSVPFKHVPQNRYTVEIVIPKLKKGDDSTDRAICQKLAAIRKRSKLRTIQRWSKRTLEEKRSNSKSPRKSAPQNEISKGGCDKQSFADVAVGQWAKQTIQRRKMSLLTSSLDDESAIQIQSVWRSHRAKILVASEMLQTWYVACDFSPDTMGSDRMIRQKAHVLALNGAFARVGCDWSNCKVLKKGSLVLVQWEGLTPVSFSHEGLDAEDTCCTVSVQCSVKRSSLLDSWSDGKCGSLLAKAAIVKDLEDQRQKLRRSSMFERSLTRRRVEGPSRCDDQRQQSETNLTDKWFYDDKAAIIQRAYRTLQRSRRPKYHEKKSSGGVPDDFQLKMQVYSAVLIQSWYRMCVCRSMYQGLRRIQSRISMKFEKDGSPIKFHRFFEKHTCETIVEEGFECHEPPPGSGSLSGDDYDF